MVDRVQYLSTSQTYYYQYLHEALYNLALKLPMLNFEGIADSPTSTSAVTLVDADLPSSNGLFNKGTLFLWWGYTGTADNPSTHEVTDHTGTTLTYTPLANMGPGLKYAVFSGTFPRWKMVQALDQALRDIGDIPVTRTINTVANQQEYNYVDSALIMTGNMVLGVEIASSTSAPYSYIPHYHWSMKHSAESGMAISFDPGHIPAGGYKMRITYMARHLDLSGHEKFQLAYLPDVDGIEIAPVINLDRLSWAAAVYALRWKVGEAPESPMFATLLNEALKRAEQLKAQFPVIKPQYIHQSNWLVGR
jgi:hypothetical protein